MDWFSLIVKDPFVAIPVRTSNEGLLVLPVSLGELSFELSLTYPHSDTRPDNTHEIYLYKCVPQSTTGGFDRSILPLQKYLLGSHLVISQPKRIVHSVSSVGTGSSTSHLFVI